MKRDARECSTGSGPTSWSATAATSRCRPTSPPAAAGCRSSSTSRTHCPAWPTRPAPGSPPGRGQLPRHAAADAEYVGLPIRRMISPLDRAALRAEARAFFGLDPDLPTLLVTGGSQGARRLNQSVSGAPRARSATPASRCSTSSGPQGEADAGADRRPPYVVVAVRRPDGPRLRRGRPGGLPGRRQQRDRGGRGRPARGLRAAADRQRRAGAQRPARRRRRRRPAGRRRATHPRVGRRAPCPAWPPTATGWPRWERPPPA